ncbi:hypothetical protein EJ110_NYTH07783 [Nymphaea thermarum]|nr:hypothetical protein EJ110_NYTH07783 [Nymphaea thermarum]
MDGGGGGGLGKFVSRLPVGPTGCRQPGKRRGGVKINDGVCQITTLLPSTSACTYTNGFFYVPFF